MRNAHGHHGESGASIVVDSHQLQHTLEELMQRNRDCSLDWNLSSWQKGVRSCQMSVSLWYLLNNKTTQNTRTCRGFKDSEVRTHVSGGSMVCPVCPANGTRKEQLSSTAVRLAASKQQRIKAGTRNGTSLRLTVGTALLHYLQQRKGHSLKQFATDASLYAMLECSG